MNLNGSKSKDNPFADTFSDPLCNLNLKETSEFVKSFPLSNGNADNSRGFLEVSAQRRRGGSNSITQRRIEAPSTPGRPVFSFNGVGNLSRKSFPSKWDDAEKWLISHHSPALHSVKISRNCDNFKQQMENFAEKSEERVSNVVSNFQGSASLDHHDTVHAFNGISCSTHILLKDKFTDSIEPTFLRYSEPTKEGFLFSNGQAVEALKDASTEVAHKDVGTEMTPLGSSTTSRCHTPFKSSSPARHNTPANRSGPLSLPNHNNNTSCTIDIIRLEECHFAKLQLGTQYDSITSHWNSREEEEEEISKSLRHNSNQKADSECRATSWEEEEKTKCCLRYQREEAKIQAWLDLQSAKAEAQSRKLEVKIQKMRSNLEEKLMKRMAMVHRKAEDWREEARQQHLEQIQKATEQAQKIIIMKQYNPLVSCSCFPCNNH